MSALAFDGVGFGTALEDFSLAVEPGETAVITGGPGKVLLLRLALGLVAPERGRIRLLGADLAEADRDALHVLRSRCVLVPHRGALVSNATVRANAELHLRYHQRAPDSEVARRVDRALAELGIPDLADARPAVLTAQERRLASLVRVAAVEPEVLLLQDPFEGLGPAASDRVAALLDACATRGCATLLTTAVTKLATAWEGRLSRLTGLRQIDRSKVGSAP